MGSLVPYNKRIPTSQGKTVSEYLDELGDEQDVYILYDNKQPARGGYYISRKEALARKLWQMALTSSDIKNALDLMGNLDGRPRQKSAVSDLSKIALRITFDGDIEKSLDPLESDNIEIFEVLDGQD